MLAGGRRLDRHDDGERAAGVRHLRRLAELERELIVERTKAGLQAARARGRRGGRPYKDGARQAPTSTRGYGEPETKVGDLCEELGITRQTLYRFVSPTGDLQDDGKKLMERRRSPVLSPLPGARSPGKDVHRRHAACSNFAKNSHCWSIGTWGQSGRSEGALNVDLPLALETDALHYDARLVHVARRRDQPR